MINAVIIIPTISTNRDSYKRCMHWLAGWQASGNPIITQTGGNSWAEAINLGIIRARTSYPDKDIILMDDDIEVTQDWLKSVEEASKTYDICGWTLKHLDGTYQYSGCYLYKRKGVFYMENYRNELYGPLNTINCSTSCVFIKKEVFDKIGLFDNETFKNGLHYEDTDFNMRAIKSGLKICCLPEYVFHKEFDTKKDFENAKERVTKNAIIFYTKMNNDVEYLKFVISNFGYYEVKE